MYDLQKNAGGFFFFVLFFCFLNLVNSITKLFLALSGDVNFLTDITAVLVYQNCHFTEQQDVTSELCDSPQYHTDHILLTLACV